MFRKVPFRLIRFAKYYKPWTCDSWVGVFFFLFFQLVVFKIEGPWGPASVVEGLAQATEQREVKKNDWVQRRTIELL